jgi:hypothetical protein
MYFFLKEVNPAFCNAGVKLVKVFKQPDAGTAMYLRQIEGYVNFIAYLEFCNEIFYSLIVKKCKSVSQRFRLRTMTLFGVNVIISTQVIIAQQDMNQLTAITTKWQLLIPNRMSFAIVTAMVT